MISSSFSAASNMDFSRFGGCCVIPETEAVCCPLCGDIPMTVRFPWGSRLAGNPFCPFCSGFTVPLFMEGPEALAQWNNTAISYHRYLSQYPEDAGEVFFPSYEDDD